MLYPVILAGGTGTRLWPVSRQSKPKHVQPFIDRETLIQKTYKRLLKGFKRNQIFVVTGKKQVSFIKKELPNLLKGSLIIEPVKKNTGPAIGLSAVYLNKKDPESVMVPINSDHYIKNEKEFLRFLKLAYKIVNKYPSHLVLLGINPIYPETGYGYIKMGSPVEKVGKDEVFEVEKFVEKPDLKIAQKFLKQWEYLWNPTWVMGRTETYLELFKKFVPATYKHLEKIQQAISTKQEAKVLSQEFSKIKADSIDYSILEKNKKMLVIPCDLGDWADIGHWRTVKDILAHQTSDNVVRGKYIHYDSKGNLVYSLSGKLIATAGVNDMIIIESGDVVLVCPKERAQDVKKLVEELEKKKMNKYL